VADLPLLAAIGFCNISARRILDAGVTVQDERADQYWANSISFAVSGALVSPGGGALSPVAAGSGASRMVGDARDYASVDAALPQVAMDAIGSLMNIDLGETLGAAVLGHSAAQLEANGHRFLS
ncbi:unnamed protein product, partial [Prorocentrum cordatum]